MSRLLTALVTQRYWYPMGRIIAVHLMIRGTIYALSVTSSYSRLRLIRPLLRRGLMARAHVSISQSRRTALPEYLNAVARLLLRLVTHHLIGSSRLSI